LSYYLKFRIESNSYRRSQKSPFRIVRSNLHEMALYETTFRVFRRHWRCRWLHVCWFCWLL